MDETMGKLEGLRQTASKFIDQHKFPILGTFAFSSYDPNTASEIAKGILKAEGLGLTAGFGILLASALVVGKTENYSTKQKAIIQMILLPLSYSAGIAAASSIASNSNSAEALGATVATALLSYAIGKHLGSALALDHAFLTPEIANVQRVPDDSEYASAELSLGALTGLAATAAGCSPSQAILFALCSSAGTVWKAVQPRFSQLKSVLQRPFLTRSSVIITRGQ